MGKRVWRLRIWRAMLRPGPRGLSRIRLHYHVRPHDKYGHLKPKHQKCYQELAAREHPVHDHGGFAVPSLSGRCPNGFEFPFISILRNAFPFPTSVSPASGGWYDEVVPVTRISSFDCKCRELASVGGVGDLLT